MASSTATQNKYFVQALASIARGEMLTVTFAQVGIASIPTLLGYAASFSTGTLAPEEVAALHSKLLSLNQQGMPKWPQDAEVGTRTLRTIIISAYSLKDLEAGDIARSSNSAEGSSQQQQQKAAAEPASKQGAEAAHSKKARDLFNLAQEVHDITFTADKRVKYEIVSKINSAMREQHPIAYALEEYTPMLTVASAKESEYEAFGQTWVTKEGNTKSISISSETELFEQMEARKQARVVAGCFDVRAAAEERGEAPPSGDQLLKASTKRYIAQPNDNVATLHCFATPAGQQVEIDAMKAFRKRNPHVPISKLVAVIDVGVEKEIANLLLMGDTVDAAVYKACTKSPELYAASLITSGDEHVQLGDDGKGKGKRPAGKSEDDRSKAMQRRLEQQDRQIANLKSNKGAGGGGGGGKGGGGGGGGGGGPPIPTTTAKTTCPPDVCQQFNFSVACKYGSACKLKHVCATCGQNHPHRGNH